MFGAPRTVHRGAMVRPSSVGVVFRVLGGCLVVTGTAVAEPMTMQIVDGVTLAPVAGASITTSTATVQSGVDGMFTIDVAAAAEVAVVAPGYEPARELVTDGGTIVLFRIGALGEVIEVTRRAPRRDGAQLARDEIRYQPGGSNDGLSAVRAMPGVGSAPPTAGGRLVIRGSAPEDSLLAIDGVPVPFLYHAFNNTTIVPVSLIGAIEYTASGFGITEGRATGGLVEISTDDTPITKLAGEASASFTEASTQLAVPLRPGLGARLGGRRSTVDLIAPLAIPDDFSIGFTTPPRFYDAFAQLDWRPRAVERAVLLGLVSYDRIGIVNRDPASDLPMELSATGRFGRLIASWHHDGSKLANRLVGAIGFDRLDTTLDAGQELHAGEALALLRDDATLAATRWLTVRAGAAVAIEDHTINARTFVLPSEGIPPERLDDLTVHEIDARYDANYAASYASLELTPVARSSVELGTRIEYYGHVHQLRALPRLRASLALGRVLLRGTLGAYARDLDQLEGVSTALPPEVARHTTLTAELEVAEGVTASVAVFHAHRGDLVIEQHPDLPTMDQRPLVDELYGSGGRGSSWGGEALVRYRRGATFGWLSYSYGRSRRDDGPATPQRSTATDQPHLVSAVISTQRAQWRFGARWQLASGQTYTEVVGASYFPELDRYVPILGAPFAARYPTSHQLDLRVERTWQRRGWRLIGFIDVTNTYRNGRVVRYQYDRAYATRTPIEDMIPLPSVGIRLEY